MRRASSLSRAALTGRLLREKLTAALWPQGSSFHPAKALKWHQPEEVTDRKMPQTGGSPAPCSLPAGVRLPFPQLLRPSSASVPSARPVPGRQESTPDGPRAKAEDGSSYPPAFQAPPLPVTVLRDLGSNFLFILWGGYVLQEAAVKTVVRNKVLHVLDSCRGL